MPTKTTRFIQGKEYSTTLFPEYQCISDVNYSLGGMTNEESKILSLLDFSILSKQEFEKYSYQLTNAFHLIQGVFMARVCIRLTGGEYWIKFDLQYEHNERIQDVELLADYSKKYIESLIDLHGQFIELEPYHPSHSDDILRAIGMFQEVLLLVESEATK